MKLLRNRCLSFLASGLFGGVLFFSASLEAAGNDPGSDISWLNRISWGANAHEYQQLKVQGREAYLASQLNPQSWKPQGQVAKVLNGISLPAASCEDYIASKIRAGVVANKTSDLQARIVATREFNNTLYNQYQDGAFRSYLMAVYSPNQLQEMMTWFWFNHFNVYQGSSSLRASVACYENDAIRANSLGNFRTLLEATLRHPAMLWYLNNDKNAVGRINENYARELIELHTLGVDGGYTQQDVQELARILTGVGVSVQPVVPGRKTAVGYIRDGLFEFNPGRHDFSDKKFLGHTIKGRGYDEVSEVLDMLVSHPSTAKFLSRKLAVYFVSDTPSDKLVMDMAAVFQKSRGDIPQVLKFLFATEEFNQSLGKKFRSPYQYWVSVARLFPPEMPISQRRQALKPLESMGQMIYGMSTPDGYSLMSAAWQGSGQLSARFDAAKLLGQQAGKLLTVHSKDASKQAIKLNNDYFQQVLKPTLSQNTQQVLDKANNDRLWNTLLLSSPEMMYR
ncbi:DUF1800 domain-containing protein [Methylobacillus flagellatus]|uniref:DUF1800 domain-containing protein n=1 Tax=Methylobacillus flagellatus TaxID=405 RepID=UPI0010F7A35A|nr:DUF1800 domain-containing protein [Methylobacillus flagellatus]